MSTYLEEFNLLKLEVLPLINYTPQDINKDGFSEFNDSKPKQEPT